jgi:hypothetical protein
MLSHFNVVANICQQVLGTPEMRICPQVANGKRMSFLTTFTIDNLKISFTIA